MFLGKNPRNSPFFLCLVIQGHISGNKCLFPLPIQAKAVSAFIIFHLYIFTHVYVL